MSACDNDVEMLPVPRIPPIDGVRVDAELRQGKSNADEADADANESFCRNELANFDPSDS